MIELCVCSYSSGVVAKRRMLQAMFDEDFENRCECVDIMEDVLDQGG